MHVVSGGHGCFPTAKGQKLAASGLLLKWIREFAESDSAAATKLDADATQLLADDGEEDVSTTLAKDDDSDATVAEEPTCTDIESVPAGEQSDDEAMAMATQVCACSPERIAADSDEEDEAISGGPAAELATALKAAAKAEEAVKEIGSAIAAAREATSQAAAKKAAAELKVKKLVSKQKEAQQLAVEAAAKAGAVGEGIAGESTVHSLKPTLYLSAPHTPPDACNHSSV